MSARMMPGAPVADAVYADLRERLEKLRTAGHAPGLATLLVGDDSASAGYIRMKQDRAAELGFTSPHIHLPQDATQADVVAAIRTFNDDPAVDGMLFQYPAPPQIDYDRALAEMDPDKDVDGMQPVNMGRLAVGLPGPVPCTPAGIEALLAYYEIPVSGREVCILGRGATLGRPLALLLSQKRPTANAAVTVVPLAFDAAVTLTASYQKIFSPDPKLGFWAQRNQYQNALDAGQTSLGTAKDIGDMQQVVFNTTLDTALTALFAVLIVIVLVDAIRVWIAALSGRPLSSGSEDPYVESKLWAPSGLIPTREERAYLREHAMTGSGEQR